MRPCDKSAPFDREYSERGRRRGEGPAFSECELPLSERACDDQGVSSRSPTYKEILGATPLFTTLTDGQLKALSECATSRQCNSGELLFSEGEPCQGFFVIASGRIRIFKVSPGGREQVLAIEGPGNSVAELPVFDGGTYPASAAAIEPTELLFISVKEFHALCLEHPEVALKVLRVVGKRLRRLVAIIEELSFTTVRTRLISWILRQADTHGPTFPLAANQQELAAQIGTVRELVSRNLSRLQAQGMIRLAGRDLTVADPEALRAELTSGF